MVNGGSHETYCLKKIVYGLEILPHMEEDAESGKGKRVEVGEGRKELRKELRKKICFGSLLVQTLIFQFLRGKKLGIILHYDSPINFYCCRYKVTVKYI